MHRQHKYDPVLKKVVAQATQLPMDTESIVVEVSKEKPTRNAPSINHIFTEETLKSIRIKNTKVLTKEE